MSFAARGEANDMQLVLTQEWQNQGDWRACFARDDRAADSTEHAPALQNKSVRVSEHITLSRLVLSP